MKTVLFYISGHGYGHVVRMAEVMRELRRMQPDWRILARTRAPRQMLPDSVEHSSADFDSGVVERQTGIIVDEPATVAKLKHLLARWHDIVTDEAEFVRRSSVSLIVADVPPIAGDIAHAARVPCIAISNFTWDWIYEPYAGEHVDQLESAYSRMNALIRLPFAQRERLTAFKRVVDAPLIVRSDHRPGPQPRGLRKRVLLGSRAQVSDVALQRAASECVDFEIVVPPVGPGFAEVLASCDLVIAKLGFGIAADCIAARKPILYPPRPNFREEINLQAEVPNHIPALPIPLSNFYSGAWEPHLRKLISMPPVRSGLETTGATFCANFLVQELLG